MERRLGLRARTDFRVVTHHGGFRSRCRGIEVSSTGIVLDRGRPVSAADEPILLHVDLHLPERLRALCAVVRPVWSFGSQQAVRIVRMADADRLTLAEHLDVLRHRGVALS